MAAPSEELIAKLLESESLVGDGGADSGGEMEVTAERNVRISESKLMTAHRNFYESWGPNAWRVIPDYVSTNAFIASSYSKLIVAFVKDLIWVSSFLSVFSFFG